MRNVRVLPYQVQWPAQFGLVQDAIAAALGRDLKALHHIGSTAVLDLAAKPVIDMLAVLFTFESIDCEGRSLAELGFESLGEFGLPGRRYFRKRARDGTRTHHLHCFLEGCADVERHLAFRDFLRAHPDVRQAYAALKIELAHRYPSDVEAYMDGKDAFIKTTEAAALAWARQRARRA